MASLRFLVLNRLQRSNRPNPNPLPLAGEGTLLSFESELFTC